MAQNVLQMKPSYSNHFIEHICIKKSKFTFFQAQKVKK